MRAATAAALLVLVAACGDNQPVEEVITAVSGSRLAVEWYRYTDGALEPGERLYDLELHTWCAPARWTDGRERCVPIADEAVFVDDTCTTAVGHEDTLDEPTYFVGRDRVAGVRVAARVYRAGPVTSPIAELYARVDGACVGPFAAPFDGVWRSLAGEVDGAALAALHERELGGGRIAVVARASDDGLLLPAGLRDRALDAPCAPDTGADGEVRCLPTGAATAPFFHDPSCERPALRVAADAEVPRFMELVDGAGCRSQREVGPEVAGPLYVRDGTFCRAFAVPPTERIFAAGPPIAAAPLARTVEEVAGRRLQRVVLADGDLAFADALLHDTATRAACRRQDTGGATRCLPAVVATATQLSTPGCALSVGVAELPRRLCGQPTFAASLIDDQVALHAIGAEVSEPLFRFDGFSCAPYTPAPGVTVHALGPPLDPALFLDAIAFGERP